METAVSRNMLLEKNDDDATTLLGCKNACSYTLQNDTNLGQKYCFASGKQKVKCLTSGGKYLTLNKSLDPS